MNQEYEPSHCSLGPISQPDGFADNSATVQYTGPTPEAYQNAFSETLTNKFASQPEMQFKFVLQRIVDFYEERIEYLLMEKDAYRKVWSASEYVYQLLCRGEDVGDAYRILTTVLHDVELDQIDHQAIRKRYQDALSSK